MVAGVLDSGNLILGSADMSTEFAEHIGAVWEPYSLEVGTAAHGGSLEVVGRVPTWKRERVCEQTDGKAAGQARNCSHHHPIL